MVCLSLIISCEQQNVVSVGAGTPGGPGVSKGVNVQTMQDMVSEVTTARAISLLLKPSLLPDIHICEFSPHSLQQETFLVWKENKDP